MKVEADMTTTALLQHDAADLPEDPNSSAEYAIYFDGGVLANPGPGAVAAVVVSPDGQIKIEHAHRTPEGTNNEMEYRGLLHAIALANLVGARRPHFVTDSQLVAQQVSGFWAINGGKLSALHGLCTGQLMGFTEWAIVHVTRDHNKRADWLVNKILRGPEHQRTLKNAPGIEFRTGALRPGWR